MECRERDLRGGPCLDRADDVAEPLGQLLILGVVDRNDDQTGAGLCEGLLQRVAQVDTPLAAMAVPAERLGQLYEIWIAERQIGVPTEVVLLFSGDQPVGMVLPHHHHHVGV